MAWGARRPPGYRTGLPDGETELGGRGVGRGSLGVALGPARSRAGARCGLRPSSPAEGASRWGWRGWDEPLCGARGAGASLEQPLQIEIPVNTPHLGSLGPACAIAVATPGPSEKERALLLSCRCGS